MPDVKPVQFQSLNKTLAKLSSEHRLIFGWAMVSKVDGEDYFDLQDHHIPEDVVLKSSMDFMLESRVGKTMHEGGKSGDIVFAFPMTTDIAKALDITTSTTGLLIAFRPGDAIGAVGWYTDGYQPARHGAGVPPIHRAHGNPDGARGQLPSPPDGEHQVFLGKRHVPPLVRRPVQPDSHAPTSRWWNIVTGPG